ncbi:DNA translocase FtsK [Colwellia sp. PAMC 21821]|uniref:DNA translocase FtsK n=1 Tax=Colwellia sp. PAMC 21821 TaxID=1816219 RepID=UPI0009C2F5BB|nr:DNA translocase FtsK [Colwellia sp. PAMC 21821]ARD45852.1 cell division protein FtsK [Colwellia sp. PAMC 21821]
MSSPSPKLNGVQRLLEAGLLVSCVFAMFIMLALFSFDPADPGWSQTGYQSPVRNLGGAVGAYLSDLLLNLFGLIAYSLPFVIAITGWLLFQKYHQLIRLDYLTLGLKFIGFILFYIGITSIASMNFDDVFYFSAGGILGDVLSNSLLPYFSFVGSTLLFVTFCGSGFVLLTGISLLKAIDRVGEYAIHAIEYSLTIPSLIKYHLGTSLEKESKTTTTNQTEPTSKNLNIDNKTSASEIDNNVTEHYIAFEKESDEVKKALESISDTEHESIFAKSDDDSAYNTREKEPYVDIDELMGEPLAMNVQEHVSDDEIAAAFEPVEKIVVDDEATTLHDKIYQQLEKEKPAEPNYSDMPSLDLLDRKDKVENPIDQEQLDLVSRLVEAKLMEFGIKAEVVGVFPGPVITRFELNLAPGVKASKITNLSKDLARSLSAKSVRVVEVIEGKSVIGIELPNKHRETVFFADVISCEKFANSKSNLAMAIGSDISGQPVIADLAKMPHLLVAGTTGSGKSVAVNTMIVSILYKSSPEDVRMIMIDPKQVELSVYDGIPHLLSEVVTDMKEAANALRWCVGEMERRYQLMSKLGVRNLKGYNDKVAKAIAAGEPMIDPLWQPSDAFTQTPPTLDKLPSIVIIVDEFADMMMIVGKKVEELIARIAQKARAAGIHLILATQRPSADVITGLIKANIPTRMALRVQSRIESRIILDQQGADQLLGMGDMFYLPPGEAVPIRVHGAFVDDHEVHAVVNDWKSRAEPNYIEEILSGDTDQDILLPGEQADADSEEEIDTLYDEALAFITESRRVSISSIQRKFRIGYNRSARIVEQMESNGVVSRPGNNGAREVLAPPPIKEH